MGVFPALSSSTLQWRGEGGGKIQVRSSVFHLDHVTPLSVVRATPPSATASKMVPEGKKPIECTHVSPKPVVAFECDDIIKRVHVSRTHEQQATAPGGH